MDTAKDDMPTVEAIEGQLKRMLASAEFTSRPQQKKLFEFLVNAALAGQEITEKDILAKFFPSPPYTTESTVARTTVNFIRKKLLPQYYAEEGADDPVLVTFSEGDTTKRVKLPPGAAYRPIFRYNPNAVPAKELQRLVHAFDQTFPDTQRVRPLDLMDALMLYTGAGENEPYPPAYAVEAHCALMYLMCSLPGFSSTSVIPPRRTTGK
jgi:hypothetical protein